MSQVVPAGDVQQVPFAFRSAAHAHEAMDGALGAYIREEMAAKGIHGFPVGAFDRRRPRSYLRGPVAVYRPSTRLSSLMFLVQRNSASPNSSVYPVYARCPVTRSGGHTIACGQWASSKSGAIQLEGTGK